MLDADFNLKLIDYGLAAPAEGRDGSGLLTTRIGTYSYWAPELFDFEHLPPYRGESVDTFAVAITLFVMYLRVFPFDYARLNDQRYRLIAKNKVNLFWETHTNEDNKDSLTPDFKELLTSMFQLDPKMRPNLSGVLASQWANGPTATQEQVREEMQERLNYLN